MREFSTILDALSSLIEKPASGLVRTHGSMFFLEIGNPLSRPGHVRPHGEWHFLFELCHWRFERQESIIVGSEDGEDFIDVTFQGLELGTIDCAELSYPSNDLAINFTSGVRFKTFSTSANATDEWTQWFLFGPHEYVWVSGGGGNIFRKKEDEPVR